MPRLQPTPLPICDITVSIQAWQLTMVTQCTHPLGYTLVCHTHHKFRIQEIGKMNPTGKVPVVHQDPLPSYGGHMLIMGPLKWKSHQGNRMQRSGPQDVRTPAQLWVHKKQHQPLTDIGLMHSGTWQFLSLHPRFGWIQQFYHQHARFVSPMTTM